VPCPEEHAVLRRGSLHNAAGAYLRQVANEGAAARSIGVVREVAPRRSPRDAERITSPHSGMARSSVPQSGNIGPRSYL
jgi:hypothetical protein